MAKQTKFAVFDTETAQLDGHVYDIGVVITNRKGEIIDTYESLNLDVYNDIQRMKGAHYHSKVDTFYEPNIRCGRMTLKPWSVISQEIQDLLRKHDIDVVAAYNLAFDMRVTKHTTLTYGGVPLLHKKGIELLDLWRVSCETVMQQKTYKKLARRLGWVSPAGNIRTNAECCYRYLSAMWEFGESHTALDDAIIETYILARCFATKKKINYGLLAHPWRLVNR